MSTEYRLSAVTIAAALHVLEEHNMNWKDWAEQTFGLSVPWPDFYVTNAALLIACLAGARIGWAAPVISLSAPAVAGINAAGFHIRPALRQRRYNPGLLTATILYVPAVTWVYAGAHRDGILTRRVALGSALAGALLMAFPLSLARIKGRKVTASA